MQGGYGEWLAESQRVESQGVSLPVALEMASAMQALVQSTADQNEAVSAMLEKRKPQYKGK